MRSKTPKFDAALDDYFSKLQLDENGGQWRTCRISGTKFYVRPEDIAWYRETRVPLPTVSPPERHRQKFAFENIYNLFKVKSAFSGKPVIAAYLPTTPYKIYEHKVWFGDQWDPMDYGRPAETEKSFFDQFHNLALDVPRFNLFVDPASVNSEYTNLGLKFKNCYLMFDSIGAEDCWYGAGYFDSRNCMDCQLIWNSDTGYALSDCKNMFRDFWCEYSQDCQDSYFLYDCRHCVSCFMSSNLRHKKHYFKNEPLSKEAYETRIKEIHFGSRKTIARLKEQFDELKANAIHRPNHNENAINSSGDYIIEGKNCYESSFLNKGENLTYCIGGINNRDSYHLFGGVSVERGYENVTSLNTYESKFCYYDNAGRGLEYCWDAAGCEDCFGCVALSKKQFCIFNRQYAEKEYWPLLDQIKTAMLARGEYGEFFPPHLSPFPYNITLATSYLGYDNVEEARRLGYPTEKIPETEEESGGAGVPAADLPDDIRDVGDDVLQKTVRGTDNKNFRIIKSELEFYRTHALPLPQENPITRLKKMRRAFGTLKTVFYARTCPRCGISFETVYPPDDPRIVYCEKDYLESLK